MRDVTEGAPSTALMGGFAELALQFGPFLFALMLLLMGTRQAYAYLQDARVRDQPDLVTVNKIVYYGVWAATCSLIAISVWVWIERNQFGIVTFEIVGLNKTDRIAAPDDNGLHSMQILSPVANRHRLSFMKMNKGNRKNLSILLEAYKCEDDVVGVSTNCDVTTVYPFEYTAGEIDGAKLRLQWENGTAKLVSASGRLAENNFSLVAVANAAGSPRPRVAQPRKLEAPLDLARRRAIIEQYELEHRLRSSTFKAPMPPLPPAARARSP